MELRPQSNAMECGNALNDSKHHGGRRREDFSNSVGTVSHHVMDTNVFITTTNVQLEGEC
jgi:hypothetical protein